MANMEPKPMRNGCVLQPSAPHIQPSPRQRSTSQSISYPVPELNPTSHTRWSHQYKGRTVRLFRKVFESQRPQIGLIGSSPQVKSTSGRLKANRANLFLGLFICLAVYSILIICLDMPYQLSLDPIISPTTLVLTPEGDPQRQSPRKSNLLQREQAEEDAYLRLRIQHALHPNITKLTKEKSRNTESLKAGKEWYTPDANLISKNPPSQFKCDTQSSSLIFLGIFTTPSSFAKRQMIRTAFKPDLPPNGLINFKFISGEPENANWRELIKMENELNNNDIVILEGVKDNVDDGKTYEYLKWVTAQVKKPLPHTPNLNREGPRQHVFEKPKFVIKADDDTFLVVPNLIKSFKDLNCQENIYWGTSQGANSYFGEYFRGLAYGLSWPLVEWIGTSNMTKKSQVGIEDARVGSWLTDLDRQSQKSLKRIDLGWKMGDWNQLEIDHGTVAMHWIKIIEWYPMLRLKILREWRKVGQPFQWDIFLKS